MGWRTIEKGEVRRTAENGGMLKGWRETRHKMEKARHRVEEDRSKEEEARRKATRRDAVRKKIAGLLKIAVGRVAFQTRLVKAG